MASASQQPTGTPSPAPEGFFKELDDRATATGVHAGAEVDGSQISLWFKGERVRSSGSGPRTNTCTAR